MKKGFRIVFVFLLAQDFFGFLSWYHLPCICNSLELESVILHGVCYMLAWLLCTLQGICYMRLCSPSIVHGICHILALQPLICVVFATVWYFKRSCGFLGSFFRLSFGMSLGVSSKVSFKGFSSGFPNVHVGFFGTSLEFHSGFHLGFQVRFLITKSNQEVLSGFL